MIEQQDGIDGGWLRLAGSMGIQLAYRWPRHERGSLLDTAVSAVPTLRSRATAVTPKNRFLRDF